MMVRKPVCKCGHLRELHFTEIMVGKPCSMINGRWIPNSYCTVENKTHSCDCQKFEEKKVRI